MSSFAAGRRTSQDSKRKITSVARRNELERAREANRIHCKETRDRKRERERLLREEVEVLTLYKSIVEDGPDLFSLHNPTSDAPFSFLCENFYQRLQLAPEDVVGCPLASIVDDRDAYALRNTLFQVLNQGHRCAAARDSAGGGGSLIHLRIAHGPSSTRGGRGPGTPGGGGGGSRRGGGFSYEPWAGWVLENYSLYTTILAAFTRKAANMSFKVHDGSRDGRGGAGGSGGGGGGGAAGSAFAEAGRGNVELLWRVTEAFCPGVTSVLSAAQNTIQRERQQDGGGGSGGAVDGGKMLRDVEKDVLEEGRKAFSSTQGPRLVTLEGYREEAEELLVAIADLTYPRVSDAWLDKLSQKLGIGPEPDKAEGWAKAISAKVKELFGLPASWRPKGHREQDGAGKESSKLSDLFHPDRDAHAPSFLSHQGRAQLASGRRACKPWDAAYVGDPMYHPRCTWETQWSVKFWVGVSEKVNERWLGWTPPTDEDEDGRDEIFEDEGPSRVIARGREFQRRAWSEGRWARLPRRLNLRALADLRATLGLVVALYFLFVACRVNATLGTWFAAALLGLSLRISVMS